jgi:hypothetical protein
MRSVDVTQRRARLGVRHRLARGMAASTAVEAAAGRSVRCRPDRHHGCQNSMGVRAQRMNAADIATLDVLT